jgi:hypothetical protein
MSIVIHPHTHMSFCVTICEHLDIHIHGLSPTTFRPLAIHPDRENLISLNCLPFKAWLDSFLDRHHIAGTIQFACQDKFKEDFRFISATRHIDLQSLSSLIPTGVTSTLHNLHLHDTLIFDPCLSTPNSSWWRMVSCHIYNPIIDDLYWPLLLEQTTSYYLTRRPRGENKHQLFSLSLDESCFQSTTFPFQMSFHLALHTYQ